MTSLSSLRIGWKSVTELLDKICRSESMDSQLYYHLVIQAYLLEEKLSQNADLEKWKEFPGRTP